MKTVKNYPNGLFNWIDLASTDIEAAKAFYSALFGWEAVDIPGVGYTMFQLNGHNVAGGSQLSEEMQATGMPPVWSSYVKHDNVDGVAEKIKAAGGSLMAEPMDVLDSGRMVFGTDPSGAAFGVWQPQNHIGADVVNAPNSLVWNELHTRDAEGSQKFYADVFDWTYKTDENGYVMCLANGRLQAGIMQMDESWGDMPPNWGVYFYVEDVAQMSGRVKELGGNVMVPPMLAGEMGTFTVVQDPQGGTFTMMEFKGEVDLPPGY